jgi:2-C-methyl-D-erythritol 4-phosphate cytidylyltransferase
MMPRIGLIVVAAGSSRRMGGRDKVWEPLHDGPVVARSLRTLAPFVAASVLVVRADQIERATREVGRFVPGLRIVAGGKERQDSVQCGLEVLPPSDVVAVHDGARPLVTADLLTRGVQLLKNYGAAIPVLPIHDTLRRVAGGDVAGETVDRSALRAVQTPQIFQPEALSEAFRAAAAGHEIVTYPGAEENFKITTEFDLRVARLLAGTGA